MTTNGTPGIHIGDNRYPTGNRVLSLGFYDGPTNGVIELADGAVYKFDISDEADDERTFEFAPLPTGTLDRLVAAIVPYHKPGWPTWCPIWKFPSDDIRLSVEAALDAILAEAGPIRWAVTTADCYGFTTFSASAVGTISVG